MEVIRVDLAKAIRLLFFTRPKDEGEYKMAKMVVKMEKERVESNRKKFGVDKRWYPKWLRG